MSKLLHYIILDAARMDGLIYKARELNEQHVCLFAGDSEAVLGHIAPWLFRLNSGDTAFNKWLYDNGAGDNWGVLIRADIPSQELIDHLRQFLMVDQEDGTELLFRFYDPRVLRVFLPACNTGELIEFFGPLNAIIMEDEDGNLLLFELNGVELKRSKLKADLKTFLASSDHPMPTIEPKKFSESSEPKNKKDRWNF